MCLRYQSVAPSAGVPWCWPQHVFLKFVPPRVSGHVPRDPVSEAEELPREKPGSAQAQEVAHVPNCAFHHKGAKLRVVQYAAWERAGYVVPVSFHVVPALL